MPTLLLPIKGNCGLGVRDVDELMAFAAKVTG
ncbi:hypothetical protein DSM112329_04776 [Paraconexibacter sp. AEG42_29]|uniref:Uncharacterized protein n=1 Tax=Paraconexibacter sp. AEG42_29 TaxID=2997339 RepID=A0AAU7B1T6_9ACTN